MPNRNGHRYRTAVGTFKTAKKAKIRAHRIVELSGKRTLRRVYVQATKNALGPYDFIFGTDCMSKFGINLDFAEKQVEWDSLTTPMKLPKDFNEDLIKEYLVEEIVQELEDECLAQQTLDSDYHKADLHQVAASQKQLSKEQQWKLEQLLHKHQPCLEGKLGK